MKTTIRKLGYKPDVWAEYDENGKQLRVGTFEDLTGKPKPEDSGGPVDWLSDSTLKRILVGLVVLAILILMALKESGTI
jgi:hypothetical protein